LPVAMLFKFLLTAGLCQSFGLRPEVGLSKAAKLNRLGEVVASARTDASKLQAAVGIVNSIMLEAGNATEHMSDDDVALLNSVIDLIDKSIYGSMDSSHAADVAAIKAAVDAIDQCNQNIALRLGKGGDLNQLYLGVVGYQNTLNDLQDDVDAKTQANATKFAELERHIKNIGAAPECSPFPADPTKPKVDIYFETSKYVDWYTAQQEAYAPVAEAFEAADDALDDALSAYAVGLAERNVAYCDWKVELEEGCAAFERCYNEKKTHYLDELKPALEADMKVRIDAYRAGETIIHQIRFLLGESTESEPPSDIDVSRFELAFLEVPAMGECSLSPLDADEWVPKPECNTRRVRSLVKYPGSSTKLRVAGKMTIATRGQGAQSAQQLKWSMTGLDTACVKGWLEVARPGNSCGVHIHSGKTCENAAEVGGHYWERDALESDPWAPIIYSTADGSSVETLEFLNTGLTSGDILGRAMVVHDSTGARIACGIIE